VGRADRHRLRGLTTLKLFGRAEAETAGIAAASDELRRRTLRVLRIAFLSSAVLEFFAALGVAGVALYVGLTFIDFLQLRASPLTLELGMFLLLMAPEVYNPLRQLAAHYHDRAAAKAAIGEIEAQLGALSSLPLPLRERSAAGRVRGPSSALSRAKAPSPAGFAVDLSPKGRGETHAPFPVSPPSRFPRIARADAKSARQFLTSRDARLDRDRFPETR
jgi:ATP-binding cassette subfamily C protein CydD